jgi:hypothetical protein
MPVKKDEVKGDDKEVIPSEAPKGQKAPPPAGPLPLVAGQDHKTQTKHPVAPAVKTEVPKIPVFMDEDEVFVDYRKPGFWSYTPSVAFFFFGIILLVLFTAGGGIIGFIIGAAILGGMMYIARYRLWARTGYWFTNHKIVFHDGSKIRLVPYDEIALSTLAFEGENCMFSTIYHHEVIIKGVIDMEQVVAYISKRVKEERKKANGAAK